MEFSGNVGVTLLSASSQGPTTPTWGPVPRPQAPLRTWPASLAAPADGRRAGGQGRFEPEQRWSSGWAIPAALVPLPF